MKKSFKKYEKAGLPGGPNELKRFTQGFIVSQRGQWDYPGLPTAMPTPSGRITMKGVEDDLLGIDNLGNSQYMTPGNEYQFDGDMVYEIPMGKKGGIKKPSKKYSKSLMSKNILFTKNPLLKKPKSVKNKIFDPNSPYFEEGGENEYNQLPKDLDPATLEKYLSDLRYLENSIKKGYRNNKWYPHSSVEGGANTIAYGHKLKKGESFASGLTEQQARDLQKEDVLLHQAGAEKFIDDKYGKGVYDSLPQNSQMLLTDFYYNLGSLNKFPSFVEGVVKGDKDKMLKEYERRGLSERNKWTKNVINNTDFSKKSNDNSQYISDFNTWLKNYLKEVFFLEQDGGELQKASYGHSIGNLIRKPDGGGTGSNSLKSIVEKPDWYHEPVVNPSAYVNNFRGNDPKMYKYGFLDLDDGNIVAGGGLGFPKSGIELSGSGFLPISPFERQYFKGVYDAKISKDINKNINLGLGANATISGYPGENGFVMDPIKLQPNISLKYNFQDGGIILDLTPEEIEEYKKGGYIVEDISVPSLTKADDGIEVSDNSLFDDKLQEIADELGVTVDDLVGIMQHESRLNPSAVNPYTGAVGLIQFMPNTAKGLGTSIDALKQMSAIDQLDYVKKFYKPIAGKAKDIGDLYMYTFLPAAVGKPDDFVIGVKDSESSIFGINQDALYKQNAVFDSEKKGYYTVGDVKKRISNFTGKPLTAPNRKKTTKRIPGKVEDTVKVIKRKHYAEPNKKEEAIPVDPRIEQLAAFSKIMAPTSENIFQLYNQGMSPQMKYGGLTRMDNGGTIQGIEGLKEDFADRLSQFIQDAESQGINLRIGSGYRSYEKQKQLWEAALKKYGSAEVARKWVAPPGSSYHNKGLAVDLHDQNSRALGKEENEEATAWAHANAKKYGLHFRMGNEPWHIEPIEFTGEDHEHTDENDVTGDILIPDLQTESKVEYDDDYSDWSPNKKEVVASDPRLEQLKAFSEIIAPSSQNINMMYQNAIKGNMKKGGFIMEIDDRDIQKYLDGGFIVEEID